MWSALNGMRHGNLAEQWEGVMKSGIDKDVGLHRTFGGEPVCRRVLLVDDDPVFRSVMARLGVRYGLDVEAYESLLEVDPFGRMQSFSGVIFDYHLGNLDGSDIATQLKAFFRDIPTLLVSADPVEALRAYKASSGVFSGFMSKSVGALAILATMDALLAENSGACVTQ